MRSKSIFRYFDIVLHFVNRLCISATILKYRLPAIAVFDIVITGCDALSNNDCLIPPWGPPWPWQCDVWRFKRTQELHSTVRRSKCMRHCVMTLCHWEGQECEWSVRQLSCSVKPVTDYTKPSLDMGWTSLANSDGYHSKKIKQTNTQTNNINKQTNLWRIILAPH